MYLLKIDVPKLTKDNAENFEACVGKIGGVRQVDTWPGRAELQLADKGVVPAVLGALKSVGFDCLEAGMLTNNQQSSTDAKIQINGMTCRSCELTIERKLQKIPGIKKVEVNATNGIARIVCADGCMPSVKIIQDTLGQEKYTVWGFVHKDTARKKSIISEPTHKPTIPRLLGLFALVLSVGFVLSKLGVFSLSSGGGRATSFFPALVLGLVAGTSSCLAVAGGLLLSSAAKFKERYGDLSGFARMKPVYLFVIGRVLSYGLLGGLIGLVGKVLTPSPLITGGLTVLAATYMIIMGLDMLKIAPAWLKGFMPRMPKSLGHHILNAESKEHPAMPMLLGGATFFLPCGFTQALQLYALTTGSFVTSALILAGFAIGTAPMLLALGWASNSLKGKAGKFFFQFSGALVVVLGLMNVQNGFAVTGHPLSFPSFSVAGTSVAAADNGTGLPDPNVRDDTGTQLIAMQITAQSPFYLPSNQYTVKAGEPVRMEISGQGTGCRSLFQIPQLGVRTLLDKDVNVLEFTPTSPGDYTFSCSMGMYRGTIKVI